MPSVRCALWGYSSGPRFPVLPSCTAQGQPSPLLSNVCFPRMLSGWLALLLISCHVRGIPFPTANSRTIKSRSCPVSTGASSWKKCESRDSLTQSSGRGWGPLGGSDGILALRSPEGLSKAWESQFQGHKNSARPLPGLESMLRVKNSVH